MVIQGDDDNILGDGDNLDLSLGLGWWVFHWMFDFGFSIDEFGLVFYLIFYWFWVDFVIGISCNVMSCGGGWMVGWICRNVLYYIKGHYKFYYIKFTNWHLTNYQKKKKKKINHSFISGCRLPITFNGTIICKLYIIKFVVVLLFSINECLNYFLLLPMTH